MPKINRLGGLPYLFGSGYSLDRQAFIKGDVPVFWGPKQPAEPIYEPPKSWYKSGSLLRTPKCVRFIWEPVYTDEINAPGNDDWQTYSHVFMGATGGYVKPTRKVTGFFQITSTDPKMPPVVRTDYDYWPLNFQLDSYDTIFIETAYGIYTTPFTGYVLEATGVVNKPYSIDVWTYVANGNAEDEARIAALFDRQKARFVPSTTRVVDILPVTTFTSTGPTAYGMTRVLSSFRDRYNSWGGYESEGDLDDSPNGFTI